MKSKLKTIIAGSRHGVRQLDIDAAMQSCPWQPSVIISGTAPGADRFGEKWATQHGVQVLRFPAAWDLFGQAAGKIRNTQMAEAAEALVAIWDGESPDRPDSLIQLHATISGLAVSNDAAGLVAFMLRIIHGKFLRTVIVPLSMSKEGWS